MSATYTDLTFTNFPDAIDTFDRFQDLTITTYPLAQEYYALYNAGNIQGASDYLNAHPDLKKCYIGASTLNPIIDSIKAVEMFYMSDVQQYLMNIVQDKGDFSVTTKYQKFNVVGYYVSGATNSYICLNSNTPIGTLPTNTTYWRAITLRGAKGESGIGLTAYGAWSSLITYPKDAMVAYNNALWGSIISNTGVAPHATTTATWYKIIEFSSELLSFTDSVTNKTYNLTVNNGNVYFSDGTTIIDIALKSSLKFEKAGGTASAITLTGVELTDGFNKTFIVTTSTSASSITVNSKPLYKPNTTTAPKLVAGKAVTIWYDASGDRFFIKASAEGNVTADKVLAPYTFSNDDDTGLTGSITSKSAATYNPSTSVQTISSGQYLSGNQTIAATIGTANMSDVLSGKTFNSANGIGLVGNIPSKSAATYTPSTTSQIITSGQYLNGTQTILGDANLLAQNILNTITIFGITGLAKRVVFGSGTTGGLTTGKAWNDANMGQYSCSGSGFGFLPSRVVVEKVWGDGTRETIVYRSGWNFWVKSYFNADGSPHSTYANQVTKVDATFYVSNNQFNAPSQSASSAFSYYVVE